MKKIGYLIIIFLYFGCSELEVKWAKKFDAAGPGNYRMNALYSAGGIYITGSYWQPNQSPSCITAKYNEKDELKWFQIYKPQNLQMAEGKSILMISERILETQQSTYVVLVQGIDMDNIKNVILIKYDSLGNIQWEKIVAKSRREITGIMSSDYQNNIYIAGWRTNIKDSMSIFIAKYQPSGELVWFKEYYNPSLRFRDLKFDNKKPTQFVAAGISENSQDFFFIRFDSSGQFLSLKKPETPEQERTLADIKIDGDGNIYLSGTVIGNETGSDYLTVVYDKDNNLCWAKQYDGNPHRDDIPKVLALDDSVNVYVTGCSMDEQGVNCILTLKYDRDGNELWTRKFKGGKDTQAEPFFLYLDYIHYYRRDPTVCNFYIAGSAGDDVVIIRYNTAGIAKGCTKYGIKEKISKPAAFTDKFIAINSISANKSTATIIRYGQFEIIGINRWD